jgi:hypothetical protein
MSQGDSCKPRTIDPYYFLILKPLFSLKNQLFAKKRTKFMQMLVVTEYKIARVIPADFINSKGKSIPNALKRCYHQFYTL